MFTLFSRIKTGILILALGIIAPATGFSHVHWTQVNSPDHRALAIYHFDSASSTIGFGDHISPDSGLPAGNFLLAQAPSGAGSIYSSSTPGVPFTPSSVSIKSAQIFETPTVFNNVDGDLTIEFWFKWDSDSTQSELTVGLKSGAKILLARDISNPGNDRFGILGTHGSFIAAPDFTTWQAVGEEEASLNEWRHVALVIHSTGIEFDSLLGHDIYKTGTTGQIWYNGHLVGAYPGNISLAGLQVHGDSAVQVRMVNGGNMSIDEMAVWRYDFSENGTVNNPFRNGRGGNSNVPEWSVY